MSTFNQGEEIAERLRCALDTPIQIGHRQIRLGLSVGVCTDHAGTAERLLAGADAAMYRDKTTHRGAVGRLRRRHLTALPRRRATS